MKGREVQNSEVVGERRWYGKPGKHHRKEKNVMNKKGVPDLMGLIKCLCVNPF